MHDSSGLTAAKPRFYIPTLDGMRAVSILLVFISHAGWLGDFPGRFGVTVFFFLSGYLITTLLRREFEGSGRVDYKAFYWRRAYRIFPPMYAALALGVFAGLVGLTATKPQLPAVIAQALHMTNYWIIANGHDGLAAGTGVMWSLAVEEHFYLIFPAVAVYLMRNFRPRQQAGMLVGAWLTILAWRVVLVVVGDVEATRTYLGTDTRLDAILLGCAMGLYLNPMLDDVPRPDRRWVTGIVGASGAVVLLALGYRNPVFRETIRYSLQTLAIAPVFYVAIQHPEHWLFRPLNLGWVRFIGTLSYSFYLVHHIVIYAVRHQLPGLPTAGVVVVAGAISLAIAYSFYRWLELPSGRLRKRHESARKAKQPATV